jgi:hypothetical protein
MHTVDLLEEAVAAARQLGYTVRHEWLGGSGGGACEVKGQRILFLDLAVGPLEQLQKVLEALRLEVRAPDVLIGRELKELLRQRQAA